MKCAFKGGWNDKLSNYGYPPAALRLEIKYNNAHLTEEEAPLLGNHPASDHSLEPPAATQDEHRATCACLGRLQGALTEQQSKVIEACCALSLGVGGIACGSVKLYHSKDVAVASAYLIVGAIGILSGVTKYCSIKAKPMDSLPTFQRPDTYNQKRDASDVTYLDYGTPPISAPQVHQDVSATGMKDYNLPPSLEFMYASRYNRKNLHPRHLLPQTNPATEPHHFDFIIAQKMYQRICGYCSRQNPAHTQTEDRCQTLCETIDGSFKVAKNMEHQSSSSDIQQTASLVHVAAQTGKLFAAYHCGNGAGGSIEGQVREISVQ